MDFLLGKPGSISGRVLDQNNEPLTGLWVLPMVREYHLGVLRYSFGRPAQTDDRGEYRLEQIIPERVYLLQAKTKIGEIEAISNVPADPELRRPAHVLTYYPNAASLDGAATITLRDGEEREGVDIRMLRSPSYCIEGVLEAGGTPAALDFWIAPQRPGYGLATSMRQSRGKAGPDGKIRICDLGRGEYRITAYQTSPEAAIPAFYSATTVAITDGDARVTIAPALRLPLNGRVVWDGPPPDEPFESQVSILLRALNGTYIKDLDLVLNATSSVPGEFSFPGVRMDDYELQVHGLSGNLYVNDILYAGTSAQYSPLSLGSGIGDAELRIVIGSDGGLLRVGVADQDKNPLPGAHVFVMPGEVTSEPDLAAKLVSGQTDQYGVYASGALVPGRYYVLASPMALDKGPESIGKIWRGRPKAKVVELGPNATEQVTVSPTVMN